MEFKHARAYGKTKKNNNRSYGTYNSMAWNYQNACKNSLITLTSKKLKHLLCSFSNINFILG